MPDNSSADAKPLGITDGGGSDVGEDGQPRELGVDEKKSAEYRAMLRRKGIEEDPNAYDRTRVTIPKIPQVTTAPMHVEIPTTAEVKDRLRDSLRKTLEPPFVKDVMDPSERKLFESMLLEEGRRRACRWTG